MSDRAVCPLTLCLFGPFAVRVHGAPLRSLRSRKGQWLLALLTLRAGRQVERAWLAGTLWPESAEAQALHSLRNSLTDLRQALGPEAIRLRSPTPHTLCLDLAGAEADVLAFDTAIAEGVPAALECAVALYRGPLLEGWAEAWVLEERQTRERAYLQALETLAAQALTNGEAAAAEGYLRRAVAVEPLRETAQRALMRALSAQGGYAAALLAYRELRLLLHRELNAEPDAETQSLFQQLRAEARDRAVRGTMRVENGSPSLSQLCPPRSLEAFPNNLPHQLTSFVGREEQMAEVEQALAAHRLVTLTGAGGCGKTRLALQVAARLLEGFPEGVWFVELAALADPALVPQTVATALGVREVPGQSIPQTLAEALRPRQMLLVLDNCEHVVGGCAALVEALLQSCLHLRVLATSREALGIGGEMRYRVPSLSLPEAQRSPEVEQLAHYEAVRLFVERASAVLPEFRMTPANATAVVEVCRRLDGMPLAIELAAARVKALSVEKIAERLDDAFRLLAGGSRTALPRHRALRALIDWSYDLLSEAERTLLRRLSVFAGGWTLEAAEVVDSGDGIKPVEVLDLLTQLVEKSLVVYEAWEEDRYRLLETVRQYARDRLLESAEGPAVRLRHLEFFLQFGEEAERELSASPSLEWLQWCESERDNLRAALEWSLAQPDVRPPTTGHCLPEMGLRLAGALWQFWGRRGYVGEGREWLERALQQGKTAPAALQAKALLGACRLAYMHENWTSACTLAEQSVARFREADDAAGLANALIWLTRRRSDPAAAIPPLAESLALRQRLGNKEGIYQSLSHLARHARAQGDHAAADGYEQERLTVAQELGGVHAAVLQFARRAEDASGIKRRDFNPDARWMEEAIRHADERGLRAVCDEGCRLRRRWGDHEEIANALLWLASLMYGWRNYEAARSLFEEALAITRALGDLELLDWDLAFQLVTLARVTRFQGDLEAAQAYGKESLKVARRTGSKRAIARALRDLGLATIQQGDLATGACLVRESLVLQQQLRNGWGMAESLEACAHHATAQGKPERAARLFGAAEALREQIGIGVQPFERPEFDHGVAATRIALGEEAFAAAWTEGRAMTLEQAIELALEPADPS